MLKITGHQHENSNQLSRREFLTIGTMGFTGLSLADILRAEAASGIRNHKSVIMIYLTGGPPHQDMVDLKPDAPSEIRGEFSPISTKLPGIQISELMPRTAATLDKFVIIRSLEGSDGRHSSFQCSTGRTFANQPQGGWPEIGSVLSRLHGPVHPGIPANIDLSLPMEHLPYNLPGPGFLGQTHSPFKPTGEALADMTLNNLEVSRFDDRRQLLSKFNAVRRGLDTNGYPKDADGFTKQALDLLTSSKLAEALDLSKEKPSVRERYGNDDPNILPYSNKGYQAIVSKFLTARRLVEAGARIVTISYADFDWHSGNFTHGRKVIPLLDQALTALVTDLHDRGMQDDVSVVVWGEFGRTPKINANAGRDHWTKVCSAILAGGGMPTGQVIGATNRYAEEAIDRPVHFNEVFSQLYHNLGIDPTLTTVNDLSGRPRYLQDDFRPLPELS
ncbi:MAG: DUF1501 domain-containing protein [Pirellulaceae bacterium]